MDTVLGLSITSSAVGLVLVEGRLADGDIVDREAIGVPADGTATSTRAAIQVEAAVSRAKQIEAAHRVHSIGLTWSDDAATDASLLLESLAQAGFDIVVPVRLPQASEAFAQGIGVVLGYTRTAVCVVQHDEAIASMVDSRSAQIRASSCEDVSAEGLITWLSELLLRESWQPEALVMVGTDMDLSAVSADLEEALETPVFAPAEAELALARGAALAAVQAPGADIAVLDDYTWEPPARSAPVRNRVQLIGITALAAGAVTFVASMAVVAGLQLTPERDVEAAANRTVAGERAAPAPEIARVPASVAEIPEVAPVPGEPEVLPEPAPVEIPEEPAYVPQEAAVAVPEPAYVPEPAIVPAAPVVAAPPVVVQQVPPVEQERPGLLGRIRDRIEDLGQPDPPPAQVVPQPVVPAPGVLPPP
ncbi:MAG: DUF7159 family protein [Mycobacterium sp.]